jgi:site-specific recombinase XerD
MEPAVPDATQLKITDTFTGWNLRMRSTGKADLTRATYLRLVRFFSEWLEAEGLSTDVHTVSRPVVEAYEVSMADRGYAASTIATAHKALQQYFSYLADEEEIARHPMAKMSVPVIPEKAVEVISDREAVAMVEACRGNTFTARRDSALLRFMFDSGCRRNEVATITVSNVDIEAGTVSVMGKGSKPRQVVIGEETALALDRYLRARQRHMYANRTDRLWLGNRGPMTGGGVNRIVQRRATQAGVGHVHAHQLRHTWAANALEASMQPDEIKKLAGWSSNAMLEHYGRGTVERRAIQSGRKHSMVDRISRPS